MPPTGRPASLFRTGAVTDPSVGRPRDMRKTLSLVGSVAVSSIFGWVGAHFGMMTGFMAGTVGGGIGMYYGYRLAARLGG